MNKLAQLWRIASHLRELRLALSGLGARLAGDDAMGGLSADETAAVCRWTSSGGVDVFVEIGTLFGFTARAVKAASPGVRVIAVDNFCWNPFGLNPDEHEAFAHRVLEGLIMDENKMRIQAESNNEIVRVARQATVPTKPVLPNPLIIFGIGVVLSL